MHPALRHAPRYLVALVLAGCAVSGMNFQRPDDNAFTLGRSTRAEVLGKFSAARLGAEAKTGEIESRASGESLRFVRYHYATAGGLTDPRGVLPVRSQTFYFHHGALVARQFVSTYAEDSTNWDETKVKELVRGVTTRAQVIETLGRPNGAYVWPAISRKEGDAIGYHHTYDANMLTGLITVRTPHGKHLVITFDTNDRIQDIEFRAGKK